MKFDRRMLKSKVHRAVVTNAEINYEGSIALPPEFIDAAHLLEYEAVNIWNVTTPARFETYVIPGKTGEVSIYGSAAHYAKKGDIIIIASFVNMSDEESLTWKPSCVYVDNNNIIQNVTRGLLDQKT